WTFDVRCSTWPSPEREEGNLVALGTGHLLQLFFALKLCQLLGEIETLGAGTVVQVDILVVGEAQAGLHDGDVRAGTVTHPNLFQRLPAFPYAMDREPRPGHRVDPLQSYPLPQMVKAHSLNRAGRFLDPLVVVGGELEPVPHVQRNA